jgi:hypothetical protein
MGSEPMQIIAKEWLMIARIVNVGLVALIGLVAVAGCSSQHTGRASQEPASVTVGSQVQLPVIGEDAIPTTGAVVEYWSNGQLKSERQYRDGQMSAAVFYASDGTLVYEMSATAPNATKTADATR